MGETTGIAWTDSTINVWHGCEKVSQGCKNCYAEVSTPIRVKRAKGLEVWGRDAARSETKGWRADLRKWQRAQESAVARFEEAAPPGAIAPKPWRVFGQSLSDTFENYRGTAGVFRVGRDMTDDTLDDLRADFFKAIEECPALTFQLLTKRPENVVGMVPASWRERWPSHVWIGTTVEDQENADARIPHLLRVPAAVRFLSVEPQVGPVDLAPWLGYAIRGVHEHDAGIQWVIQGGESGHRARPFDLAWARSLRDQCKAAEVPYFLKQLGARPIGNWYHGAAATSPPKYGWTIRDSHGGDESEWPADLHGCRAFPA